MHWIIVVLSLVSSPAWAQAPLWGAEMTFFVPTLELNEHPTHLEILNAAETLLDFAPKGTRLQRSDEPSLILPSGFEIRLTPDGQVIEVVNRPASLQEWRRNQKSLQKLLFEGMASLGYRPHPVFGAGHLNGGLQTLFKNDVMLLKAFMTDFFNTPVVAMVLGSPRHDREYAKGPWSLARHYQLELVNILKARHHDLRHFSRDYHDFLRRANLDNVGRNDYGAEKYVALRIREVHEPEISRLEFRTVRPQQSIQDFILVAELFEKRLQYLIANPRIASKPFQPQNELQDVTVGLRQFVKYVEETGLDPADYSRFIAPEWTQAWKRTLTGRAPRCRTVLGRVGR